MVILNPSTRIDPFIPLSVTNFSSLYIQVFQVEVDDYSSTESSSGIHMTCMEYQKNPGKKVYDEVVELQCEIDEPFEYKIPLGSHLQHSEERYGLLLVVAQPTETAWEQCGGTAESYVYRQTVRVWVQCTQLALDVYPDHITRSYTTLVSSLENGAPVDKATVRVGRHTSLTDEYGLTVVEAEHADRQEIISVQKDKDITFLPSVSVRKLDDQIFGWYVFDSRGVYRPTEEVHIKGYLRKLERKKNGGQQPVYAQGRIRYTVHDSRWNKLTMGDIPLNEYGSFFLVFRIQDNANLGDASVALEYVGEQGQESRYCHKVKIQEFRKPEFEVTTSHWGSSVLYTHPSKNSFVIASTSAKYYAGGPLEGARVLWVVQPSQTYYAPPGHPQYIFGSNDAFIPGCWRSSNWRSSPMLYPSYELSGKTDTNGKHEVKIEFGGIEDRPSSISVSATSYITDLNCQVQSATTDFMIHASSVFVGFKLKDTFGKKGEKVMGEVIVCDVNGKPLPGVQVKVSIAGQGKQEKEDDNGLSAYVDASDEQDISLESDEKPMEFSFIPCLGGMYSMAFRVIDSENRYNESRCTCFYVSGGCTSTPLGVVSDFIPKEEAQIIPDKDMYEGGETANLLIQSPFWPAEGLLIMKYFNTNVGDKIRFQMQSNAHILSTYLDPDWIPRIDLQVLLLGSTLFKSSDAVSDTKEILRPAYATAESSINIALSCHRLLVHIAPMRAEEAATPGGTVHVSVKVTEEKSQAPLGNAEISIVMVDEAILHLGAYSLKDPLSSFYPECKDCHSSYHLREYCLMPGFHVRFSMPLIEAQCFANCFLQSARLHTENVNIARVRSNFTPLAAFVPHCKTNGNGIAEVRIDLPDNLTRYRIWAVAATEAQFGLGESSLDVQLPIMIRTSPPRFLNLEDKALISVVLQNQTNISLPLLVGMRKSNAKVEAESVGYSLTLHGSQRVAIPFHVVAAATGTAQFQVVVSTQTEENRPPFSDAAEVSVPIFIPSSSERVAIYGDMDETNTIVQPIKSPMDVFPLYGGLDISTSSTTLQTLTDGLLYLHSYPFDCNEQLASRIIGFLSLWEVMKAFRLKDLPQEELMIKLKTDLKILKDRQLSCGGWSWWTSGNNVKHQPFISLHVACALVMASKYDFLEVDSEMLENALGFCADIEVHLNDDNETNICVKETKSALLAYALYVLALNNKDVGKQASALLQKASMSQLSLEACGWILTALGLSRNKNNNEVKGLIDHVKSKVVETGAYAHFTTSYHDDGMSVMLHSNCRTDAILLEALLVNEASSPLCVKLAKGLQSQRRGGRWNSTQENCFVLSALNRFFVLYEKEEPNFTANVWMGEKWIMSLTCLGRSIETKQVKVPMVALLSETSSEGMTQLLLQKKGEGRLYFRIGLEYTPRLLQQRAVSYGFSITRIYEGVRSPLHAVYDANTQTWELAAGEKVKVTLSLGTNCVRHHVALVDYLPAGCEPINPALEALSAAGKESSPCCVPWVRSWVRSWVDHVNMRDERIEAFCTVLRPGRYEYSYEMRATCRGMFIIPSSRVEEMYNPENFGRSASERCRIS
ncbi:hypothetical protein KP509_19G068600 [Ceratopteris richardii]|nr:hypothetical protein KP509_19G068600 [Ceratopteris richardii]